MDKVSPEPMSGCWLWSGAAGGGDKKLGKYGRMLGTNGPTFAHRVSHELFIGPIPSGFDVDHKCRNRMCVNPTHLEAVSRLENLKRGQTLVAANLGRSTCVHGHAFDRVRISRGRPCRDCSTCNKRRRKANA